MSVLLETNLDQRERNHYRIQDHQGDKCVNISSDHPNISKNANRTGKPTVDTRTIMNGECALQKRVILYKCEHPGCEMKFLDKLNKEHHLYTHKSKFQFNSLDPGVLFFDLILLTIAITLRQNAQLYE